MKAISALPSHFNGVSSITAAPSFQMLISVEGTGKNQLELGKENPLLSHRYLLRNP